MARLSYNRRMIVKKKPFIFIITRNLKKKNLKKKFIKHQKHPITAIRIKQVRKKAERAYKDTVFTKLFNHEEAAIQLYNALYNKNLSESTPVRMMTLDDTLFRKRKNDVAFIIGSHF